MSCDYLTVLAIRTNTVTCYHSLISLKAGSCDGVLPCGLFSGHSRLGKKDVKGAFFNCFKNYYQLAPHTELELANYSPESSFTIVGNIHNGVICDLHSSYTVIFFAAICVGRLIIIK